MCHMSRVTCHMSHVTFFSFFLLSGEAYWWRVWYQQGLPHLVYQHIWHMAYGIHGIVSVLGRKEGYTFKFTLLQEFNFNIPSFRMIYCIRIRTRGGIYGQIYPSVWRSSWGQSPRELLKTEGYIWPCIPSRVLIRTLYNFNNH